MIQKLDKHIKIVIKFYNILYYIIMNIDTCMYGLNENMKNTHKINDYNTIEKYFNIKCYYNNYDLNNLNNNSKIIINGLIYNHIIKIYNKYKSKNFNWINVLFLINNQNLFFFFNIYKRINIRLFTDSIFIYSLLKKYIPVFIHPMFCNIIDNSENNIENNILIDCRRIDENNKIYIKNLKLTNNLYKLVILKLNNNNEYIKDYDNIFLNSKILVYICDNFNIYRTSKKICDAIIQNKYIILQKGNNWTNLILKHINYPNFMYFNNYSELNKIINIVTQKKIIKFNYECLFYNTIIPIFNDDRISKSINYYNDFLKLQSKKIIIMGNGPSKKDIDFTKIKNIPVLGMNFEFDNWYKMNWFPDIYCCLDIVVLEYHFNEILKLIQNKKCKIFFLRNIFKKICKSKKINISYLNIYFLEDMKNIILYNKRHITTGSFSIRFAMFLGYKDIRLIGLDNLDLIVFDHIKLDLKNKYFNDCKIYNYSSISKIKTFNFKNINLIYN